MPLKFANIILGYIMLRGKLILSSKLQIGPWALKGKFPFLSSFKSGFEGARSFNFVQSVLHFGYKHFVQMMTMIFLTFFLLLFWLHRKLSN